MNSLPVEMLKMIVDQVPAGKDLRNIRALNRTFCALSTPRVFRRIQVRNTIWHAEAFENVVQSKAAIPYLEEIVFRDIYAGEDGNFLAASPTVRIESYYPREIRESLSSTFSRLHELLALKTLVLMFFPEYMEDFSPGLYYPSGHSTLQLAILTGLSRLPSLSLTSLTIAGLIAVHNELFDTPPFCALFERLTYLRLGAISKTFFGGSSEHEKIIEFWEKAISQRILEPRASLVQSLTSLTLHSDHDVDFIPAIDFSQLTCSGLAFLSLKNISFDEVSMNVEDFIVRHGGTLKTLELKVCRIAIHDPEQGPTRFWSQIWNLFLVEMGALMKLSVEDVYDPGSGRTQKYVRINEELGYTSFVVPAPSEELDKAAFEALNVLLESRRVSEKSTHWVKIFGRKLRRFLCLCLPA